MGKISLLIDFGSTFTKIIAIDLEKEEVLGNAQAPTTIKEDVMIALNHSLEKLELEIGKRDYEIKLACSSAAGGLKLVAVGLVPELTLEAAKKAALGAGANLIGAFAYNLNQDDISQIEKLSPDVVLLCGGTDGGNERVVFHNAVMLARSKLNAPFIYAGNNVVAGKCRSLLEKQSKEILVTENVMPELEKLNAENVQRVIREVFLRRIVKAKGIDRAQGYVDSVLMPTPSAVLKAAVLLADGFKNEKGLGELIIIDVGGATTDVHSVSFGTVVQGAIKKGVEEPVAMRTVEGDIGVRYNARSIVSAVGEERMYSDYLGKNIENLNKIIENLVLHTERLPQTEEEKDIDTALASAAVDIAMERHAGTLEIRQLAGGVVRIQHGKNLMETEMVIGTGGAIIKSAQPRKVLERASFNQLRPNSLKPQKPKFLLDERYALYAFGLLSEFFPEESLRMAKIYLKELTESAETTS